MPWCAGATQVWREVGYRGRVIVGRDLDRHVLGAVADTPS
jgi:hypothetical protein